MHGQTKPYIQELRYIQLACYTQVKAHSKAKRTVFNYLRSLSNADICDGEDYCYFIINNHLPRAKCYRSTFTLL